MKKILLVLVIVGVMAGGAFAGNATGPTVPVTATVTEKCSVADNGSISVTIDPTLGAGQTWNVNQPQVKCTKTKAATTATVTAQSDASGNPSNSTGTLVSALHNGTNTDIPYTFTFTSAVTGDGFGGGAANVNFGIGASITAGAANAAEYTSSNYVDHVTLTLAY